MCTERLALKNRGYWNFQPISILFFCATAIFVASTAGLQDRYTHIKSAVVEDEEIWTNCNRSISILCKTEHAEPLRMCYWTVSSHLNPNSLVEAFNISSKYTELKYGYWYNGKGLRDGECGITVGKVHASDFGLWNCTLITDKPRFYAGTVKVSQWKKPSKPVILSKELFSHFDERNLESHRINATCCTWHGRPIPKLTFVLGTDTVNDSVVRNHSANQTCIYWPNARFTYKDNGKKFQCRVDHISFSSEEIHATEDSVPLSIIYSPRLQNGSKNSTVIVDIDLGTKFWNSTIKVHGNPIPKVSLSPSSSLDFGSSELSKHFEFHTSELNNDTVEAKLKILDVQQLSSDTELLLTASNLLGSATMHYRFTYGSGYNKDLTRALFIVLYVAVALITITVVVGFIVWRVRRAHSFRAFPVPRLKVLGPNDIQNRATGEVASPPEEAVPMSSKDGATND